MSLIDTEEAAAAASVDDWVSIIAAGHQYGTGVPMAPDARDRYLARDILCPLFAWQEESLRFAAQRERDEDETGTRGLMLCHEQGLGKTLIVLQHILRDNQARCALSGGRRFNGATLIVCKDTLLLENWLAELRSKWPHDTFQWYYLKTSGNERIDPVYLSRACDIVFVTYATLRAAYTFGTRCDTEDDDGAAPEGEEEEDGDFKYAVLYRRRWRRVVADEGHLFVNPNTVLYRAMQALDSEINWDVTGTPIQNAWQTLLSGFAFIRVPNVQQRFWSADRRPCKDLQRALNEICARVMLRYLKRDVAMTKELGLFTVVTKRIRLIEFESPLERLVYFQYAFYSRLRARQHTRRQHNTGFLILLLLQLCLNMTILRRLVLPAGMLTDPCAQRISLANEPVLLPGEEEAEDDDATSLTAFAARLAWRTVFTYRASQWPPLPSIDGYILEYRASLSDAVRPLVEAARDETFVWDPYAASREFDLSDSADDRHLYTEVYNRLVGGDGCDSKEEESEKESAMRRHLMQRTLPRDFCATKNLHVIDYVEREMAPDECVIVFATSVKALEALGRDLRERRGIESVLVSGRTPKENADRLRQFAQPSGGPRVLLMSMKLGAMGLNITRANHVIFLHRWWNPEFEAQAAGRPQRIGQTKPIHIVHFVMNKTVELFVTALAYNKTCLTRGLIDHSKKKKRKQRNDDDAEDIFTSFTLSYDFAEYGMKQLC